MPKLPKKQIKDDTGIAVGTGDLSSKRAKKVRATTSLQVAQFILSCVVTGAVVGILLTIIAMR